MSSKNYYRYEELKEAARKARSTLFAEGKFRTEQRIRRKPRDPDDLEMLFQKAMSTLRKYPPRKSKDRLILPYLRM
ncbi:MAG: hypothetical protein RBS57_09665 [Desulforhabdus sp.]|jgi:hypothetical protein|nr:hypothetical protein [Desulforhabdus sp.]